MARIRTVKPDFWRDEDLSKVSAEAALLAIGLLNHADDEGYFNANPKLIESDVFPLRELSGSVTVLIEELRGIGYVKVFSGSDGKRYGHVVNFEKHQVINKKNASKIKDLCLVSEECGSPTVVLPVGMEWNGKEKEEAPRKRVGPPDGVCEQTWSSFLAVRRAKKAPVSELVIAGIQREAAKAGWTLEAALSETVTRGWTAFKADWVTGKPGQTASSSFAGVI